MTNDKSLAGILKRNKKLANKALTASYMAIIDSGATAHMIKDVLQTTRKEVTKGTSVLPAGKDTITARTQCESTIKLSGGEGPARLNLVLHVPNAEYSLICALCLCDDD